MKIHTVALVVSQEVPKPILVDVLLDDQEITCLENALKQGEVSPLYEIHQRRSLMLQKESQRESFVEEFLTRPFLKPSLQDRGITWLKSRIKLENHRKAEQEAIQVIAEHALKLFQEDPTRTDFFLEGGNSRLRIRVFPLSVRLDV